MILLIALPLRATIKAQKEDDHSATAPLETNLLAEHKDEDRKCQDEAEMNLLQAIGTINFWLLFICLLCKRGSGLATINNLRKVGESLNYIIIELNTLVSLWSILDSVGRFSAGYISGYLWHTKGLTRPMLMAITQAIMTVSHVIIASGSPGNLYLGTFLVGTCNGSVWSLMPIIASEIFGIKHMGIIFNAISLANLIGVYIFAVRIVGFVFDRESTSGDGNSCKNALYILTHIHIMFLSHSHSHSPKKMVALSKSPRMLRKYVQQGVSRLSNSQKKSLKS